MGLDIIAVAKVMLAFGLVVLVYGFALYVQILSETELNLGSSKLYVSVSLIAGGFLWVAMWSLPVLQM